MLKITRALVALTILAIPFTAFAGIPSLWESWAEMGYQGPENLSLLTVPNGSGNPFTEAYLPDGSLADGTITLHVIDSNGVPIAYYPSEDLWLGSTDNGLTSCAYTNLNPDSSTDEQGVTTWHNPLPAGGHSMGLIQVYISGSPLISGPGLNLYTNSPDINGDMVINLTDVALFAEDFYNPTYMYRSDFFCDGTLNLLDVGKISQAFGATCP